MTPRQNWACGMLAVVGALFPLGGGCHQPTHREARLDATREWNNVRAGVKEQLARQQFEQGLFTDAIATATDALALSPRRPECYVVIALGHLELGQLASASAILREAERRGITHGDLHYARGVILEQRGDDERAVEAFAQAQQYDTTRIEYLLARAECLATLDRTGEALELLARNIDRFDDSHEVATLAGRVAELGREYALAAEYYSLALTRGASDPPVHASLAANLAAMGRCEQAIGILVPILDDPQAVRLISARIRRAMAVCLVKMGNPQRAFDLIAEYAGQHPEDTAATAIWAIASWRGGDSRAALKILSQTAAGGLGEADLCCLRGEILARLGRGKEASEAFLEALRASPGDSWASGALSRLALEGAGP